MAVPFQLFAAKLTSCQFLISKILVCCSLGIGLWFIYSMQPWHSQPAAMHRFDAPIFHTNAKQSSKPLYSQQSLPRSPTKEVHAASITQLNDEQLFAIWYGGSREGATDVKLYSSTLNLSSNQWTDPKVVMTPKQLQRESRRWIKKLGNPVVLVDRHQRLIVFFVSVSIGGWGGSSINAMFSTDGGEHFSTPQRLITSPFFNLSTLVKSPPFLYANGDIGLPVYHEFIGKFSELLRLSPLGEVIDKHRISHGDRALQPSMSIHSPLHASVWSRNSDQTQGHTLINTTSQGGDYWSAIEKTSIPNPDSAVSTLSLEPTFNGSADFATETLIVYNNSKDSRHRLSLGYTTDFGQSFKILIDLENGDRYIDRYSYPQITRSISPAGELLYNVIYTSNRKTIEHVQFNHAWLKSKIKFQPADNPQIIRDLATQESNKSAVQYSNFLDQSNNLILNSFALFILLVLSIAPSVQYLLRQLDFNPSLKFLAPIIASLLIGFWPIGSSNCIGILRGVLGDLSCASWVLLLIGSYRYYLNCFGALYFTQTKFYTLNQLKQFVQIVGLLGILFYPFALGFLPYDPYIAGYPLEAQLISGKLISLLVLAIYCYRNTVITFWIALTLVSFYGQWFEATNLWDYLLDPLAVGISLYYCICTLINKFNYRIRSIRYNHEKP